MTVAGRNTWVGRVLVEELSRLGTPLVCLAPGARCAPLSMALGASRGVPWTTFVDERAAAFHALGVGRATGRPAVVVTTSGTAVGNLVPAAMEADRAGIPLVLMTADRPAELRHTGANQTVLQAHVLAPLVRHRVDLPCSDPAMPFSAILSTLDQAVDMAVRRSGPVHLNLQFREPLGPAEIDVPPDVASWWSDEARRPWCAASPSISSPVDVDRLRELGRCQRGLVVVGSLPHGARRAVQSVVHRLGWPAYCSPDSGVDGGAGLDSALSDGDLARRLAPDTVLWLGGGVVSKRLVGWLRGQPSTLRLVSIAERDVRIDPAFRVTERFVVGFGELAEILEEGRPSQEWVGMWRGLRSAARRVIASYEADWSELSAARVVIESSGSVFLGASLPIRLADWMGSGRRRLAANRGASGIDGVLATATGWGRHVEGPCKVLVGDLTCLHDQGSLPLIRETGLQAVVFNNQGGSIFGMLPFGEVQGFDRVFRNVHTQAIAPLAAAHGLRVAVVEDLAALKAALGDGAVDLVEARFVHERTIDALAALHRDVVAEVKRAWT